MTFAAEEAPGTSYLGFDFGTSTSACSFVDSRNIQVIEMRSRDQDWRELSDLLTDLPYPAAAPLARFISEMDPDRRREKGREAAEGMLGLAAYVLLAERCSQESCPTTSYFKNLPHRSAGPLWGLLKQLVSGGKTNLLAQSLQPLTEQKTAAQIDAWVGAIASGKHGKAANVDYVPFLQTLGNYLSKLLHQRHFGIFESVTPKRFSAGTFTGLFRVLSGSSQTFVRVLRYEGNTPFSDADVFLVEPQRSIAFSLSPFYYWSLGHDEGDGQDADLYEFDSVRDRDKAFTYRSIQIRPELPITEQGTYAAIWTRLADFRQRDQSLSLLSGIGLTAFD